jgi:hypothetical protein
MKPYKNNILFFPVLSMVDYNPILVRPGNDLSASAKICPAFWHDILSKITQTVRFQHYLSGRFPEHPLSLLSGSYATQGEIFIRTVKWPVRAHFWVKFATTGTTLIPGVN